MEREICCQVPPTAFGLELIIINTLALRRAGYKTRLAERLVCGFSLLSIVATRERPNRAERGCNLGHR
jgi:hypothetical protein